MRTTHKPLVKHAFKGGRFDDHGVDLDALPELLTYKNILVETAKELWRAKHPDRKQLPRNFEESLQLKFYTVEKSSAVIPIERVIMVDEQGNLFEEKDELDEAVNLIADVAEAVENDSPIPQGFPSRILNMFENYGKTLREDEYFEYRIENRTKPARYNMVVRERLAQRTMESYEDSVDIIGTVTMASVRKPKLGITLNDGREIEAIFQPEDEEIVLAALTQHHTAKIRLEGRGIFQADGMLQRIIHTSRVTHLPSGDIQYSKDARPIWQVVTDLSKEIPEEELNSMPRDGSINHDHYLYGTPKRAE
jgi:hypothetical protein